MSPIHIEDMSPSDNIACIFSFKLPRLKLGQFILSLYLNLDHSHCGADNRKLSHSSKQIQGVEPIVHVSYWEVMQPMAADHPQPLHCVQLYIVRGYSVLYVRIKREDKERALHVIT